MKRIIGIVFAGICFMALPTIGGAAPTECAIPVPNGMGCTGCRSLGVIVTKTTTFPWFNLTTGQWENFTLSAQFRLWKLCDSTLYDLRCNVGNYPASNVGGALHTPNCTTAGATPCGAAAKLFWALAGTMADCSGATPQVPLTDPDLAGQPAAVLDCSTFTYWKADLNWTNPPLECGGPPLGPPPGPHNPPPPGP